MKEGLTAGPILLIVIFFILLFVGIMSTTLNRANASGVKNDVVQYIKNYRGKFRDGTTATANLNSELINTLKESDQYATGKCGEGFTGYTISGEVTTGANAVLCVRRYSAVNNFPDDHGNDRDILADIDKVHGCYYVVQLYYSFYIPMISSLWNMRVTGQTPIVYNCEYIVLFLNKI